MVDRRGLLIAAPALLLTACGTAAEPSPTTTPAPTPDGTADAEELTALLAFEQRAVAFYAAAAGRAEGARGATLARLLQHERAHAAALRGALRARGARPPEPPAAGHEGGDPLAGALALEREAVAAYERALPRLHDPDLRVLAASILATEAEHLAVVRSELGRVPAPAAFVTGSARA